MKKLFLVALALVGVGFASSARAGGVNLHVDFGIPLPPVPVFINHSQAYRPACPPPRYVAPCPPARYCPPGRTSYSYGYRQHGNRYGDNHRYNNHGYGGNYQSSYRQYGCNDSHDGYRR